MKLHIAIIGLIGMLAGCNVNNDNPVQTSNNIPYNQEVLVYKTNIADCDIGDVLCMKDGLYKKMSNYKTHRKVTNYNELWIKMGDDHNWYVTDNLKPRPDFDFIDELN